MEVMKCCHLVYERVHNTFGQGTMSFYVSCKKASPIGELT